LKSGPQILGVEQLFSQDERFRFLGQPFRNNILKALRRAVALKRIGKFSEPVTRYSIPSRQLDDRKAIAAQSPLHSKRNERCVGGKNGVGFRSRDRLAEYPAGSITCSDACTLAWPAGC